MKGFVIQHIDDNTFFSCGIGRNYGSPQGGWTSIESHGLRFARHGDARDFVTTFLRHQEPFTKISACLSNDEQSAN